MAIPPFSHLADQPRPTAWGAERRTRPTGRSSACSPVIPDPVCYSQASPDGQTSLSPPAALQTLHHEWDW